MADEEIMYVNPEDIQIVDKNDYVYEIDTQFMSMPEIAKPLIVGAKKTMKSIEKMLCSAPVFISMVEASAPKEALQAILTDEQKKKIADGALKLMTKKDGSLMANLVDPKTNKIVSSVSLQKVKITPEITQAITNYATQMQMAQIAEEIHSVQLAIDEVRQGQEFDRLAMAYSCQQKLLQATKIRNPELKAIAMMKIASDAEDSRNQLMLSQNANLTFIKNQPESFWGKLTSGSTPEKIEQRMSEIRESLLAVNMVSLVEAMAYQEMGETEAAKKSLEYYSDYIESAYLSTKGLVERLDLLDSVPENYWSKTLPEISNKINMLPCMENQEVLEDKDGE